MTLASTPPPLPSSRPALQPCPFTAASPSQVRKRRGRFQEDRPTHPGGSRGGQSRCTLLHPSGVCRGQAKGPDPSLAAQERNRLLSVRRQPAQGLERLLHFSPGPQRLHSHLFRNLQCGAHAARARLGRLGRLGETSASAAPKARGGARGGIAPRRHHRHLEAGRRLRLRTEPRRWRRSGRWRHLDLSQHPLGRVSRVAPLRTAERDGVRVHAERHEGGLLGAYRRGQQSRALSARGRHRPRRIGGCHHHLRCGRAGADPGLCGGRERDELRAEHARGHSGRELRCAPAAARHCHLPDGRARSPSPMVQCRGAVFGTSGEHAAHVPRGCRGALPAADLRAAVYGGAPAGSACEPVGRSERQRDPQ